MRVEERLRADDDSPATQRDTQTTMQKDLVYRTCSLKTVQLAQDKGLEEEHHDYSHYPDKLAFTLKTSAQIYKSTGFGGNFTSRHL